MICPVCRNYSVHFQVIKSLDSIYNAGQISRHKSFEINLFGTSQTNYEILVLRS